MCKFNKKNDARRFDPCIKNLIKELKKNYPLVGSCCGHFKYTLTLIVERKNKTRYDLVSGVEIPRRKKSYKKDKNGIYFVPEVEEYWRKNG